MTRYGTVGLLLAAAAAGTLIMSSNHAAALPFPWLILCLGASFGVVGVAARARRPENATGLLLYGIGIAMLALLLTEANHPALFTFGLTLNALAFAAIAHLLLAYPTGRLTGSSRAVVAAGYLLAALGPAASMLFTTDPVDCANCPRNLLTVTDRPGLADAVDVVTQISAALLLVSVGVLLVRRWRRASSAYRRALRAVYGTGAVVVLLLVCGFALGPISHDAGVVAITAAAVSFGALPLAFLLGLLRARLAGAAVGRLVTELGPNPRPGQVRQALRDVLHDQSLEIGYRLSGNGGYVDIAGLPFVPEPGAAVTEVVGVDGPVGLLAHDPALLEDPRLLEGVAGSVQLAFENERLHAELRARLVDLRASRARIVEAGDEERRKLERNLHDGAQQRLVSILISLRLVATVVDRDPEEREAALRRLRGALAGDCRAARARARHPSRRSSPTAGSARRSSRWRDGRRCQSR